MNNLSNEGGNVLHGLIIRNITNDGCNAINDLLIRILWR